jgi:hypothetical protein
MHCRVLLCIADEEVTIDVLDAERRKAGGDIRIFEATGCCRLRSFDFVLAATLAR